MWIFKKTTYVIISAIFNVQNTVKCLVTWTFVVYTYFASYVWAKQKSCLISTHYQKQWMDYTFEKRAPNRAWQGHTYSRAQWGQVCVDRSVPTLLLQKKKNKLIDVEGYIMLQIGNVWKRNAIVIFIIVYTFCLTVRDSQNWFKNQRLTLILKMTI